MAAFSKHCICCVESGHDPVWDLQTAPALLILATVLVVALLPLQTMAVVAAMLPLQTTLGPLQMRPAASEDPAWVSTIAGTICERPEQQK